MLFNQNQGCKRTEEKKVLEIVEHFQRNSKNSRLLNYAFTYLIMLKRH